MDASSPDVHRTAIGVVRGMDRALVVERKRKLVEKLERIERLDDRFPAIVEASVAEHESIAAGSEIVAVRRREPVDDSGDAQRVAGASPRNAAQQGADARAAVDLGEAPGLGRTVAPAKPCEHAERLVDLLLDIHAEAVLRARCARGS